MKNKLHIQRIYQNPKLYLVIGPTASGKSEYAVRLAKKYNGEIISADSRQVYRGLDIGTGKVLGKWTILSSPSLRGVTSASELRRGNLHLPKSRLLRQPGLRSLLHYLIDNHDYTNNQYLSNRQESYGGVGSDALLPRNDDGRVFIYKGIVHHCIDYVSPKRQYSVADFKRDGMAAMKDIISRGKTPIVCGGTGQFVDALMLDQNIPEVPPDEIFRKRMEQKSAKQLFVMLKKEDLARAESIDHHNKRRLIRALEIIHTTGKPVPTLPLTPKLPYYVIPEAMSASEWLSEIQSFILDPGSVFDSERSDSRTEARMTQKQIPIKIIHLNPPRAELYKKIEKRFDGWLKQGLVKEVKKLREQGVSRKRITEFGLEYKYIVEYLRGKIDHKTMREQSIKSIQQYSKRQQTWFKKYHGKAYVKMLKLNI